ncbi:NitT/TauT family transport system substrate-binding protein [Arthrobacter pigmenti]|uniref:NitT/TauT family transport system substrate-binding protein n=1 Tax=Arthrobacter pigmenti TaxID=271432 RepID=A0A846RK28_9MICC|nr:aliphatic sulfonate ABC transporter substrate-binding protein [Arthrobacter pigmenti]NJC21499.1 NitT/TauT family transport system substrate-binding protein [Arthrobacter pigmenti]
MKLARKLIGAVAIGVTATLALAGCGGSTPESASNGEETIDVTFGYIGDFNGTSLLAVAEQEGIWEKHGLNVTESVFTNGPLQIQALGTGDLDFGYIGPGAMWLPASGQAKVVAINTLGQADRVVAQPGIESIEELRGKTVAVPEGTSGDMILTLALESAGMTKEDVELVPMEPATIVSALASGQVDGAGFWYPALATVKEQVPGLVELAQNTDFEDQVSFPTAFVAGNDVVANEPEKVDRVLAALREAMQYRSDNMEDTIAATAAMLGLEPAQVEADANNVQVLSVEELDSLTEDGTINTWLSGMNDYFISAEKLPEPVDPSEYYTGDLFTGAGQ